MSRTILLADDSLTIQKVVELTFADTDYEVIAVSSGDDLLERLSSSDPNLIICDVIMPGRDGYDVCHEIKSNPDTLHLPVILLTGTFEPFDRDRALAVGCSEIITKPFEARKLVEAVNRLATDAKGGAPPAAASIDPETATGAEGQVAPPPAIEALESVPDFEDQLEDTAVSTEFGPGPEVEPVVQAEPAGEISNHDTVDFEAPDDSVDFEVLDHAETREFEPAAELPVAEPLEGSEIADIVHETAATVVDQDIAEMMEDDPGEVFVDHGAGDEVFPSTEELEEPFPATSPDPPPAEPPTDFEVDHSKTTPIRVGEVLADPPAEEDVMDFDFDATTVEAEEEFALEVDDISDADTQDFEEAPATADETILEVSDQSTQESDETRVEAVVPSEESASALSDEDIDRIARRVLELSRDRIEHIAWDVIPDMAEIVVRERVREIEAEADKPS